MKKIIYVVNTDTFFLSHRLELALAAQNKGYAVSVMAEFSKHKKTIESYGFQTIDCFFKSARFNPFKLIYQGIVLYQNYAKINPDIIHHISLKSVLFGSFAALFLKNKPKIVNALTGLGYSYTSNHKRAKILRFFSNVFLRLLLKTKRSKLILQNPDDASLLLEKKMIDPENVVLIKGSGVDTEKYEPQPFPDHPPFIAMFASRLLKDKGIFDFIEAARIIQKKKLPIDIVIVGDIDKKNPSSLKKSDIETLKNEGVVSYCGHQKEMMTVWPKCHIAVLPSYREGLPKALLEAMAIGRPLITTDAPGCREVIDDGINGFRVPVNAPKALAEALEKMCDINLLEKMGRASRQKVEGELSLKTVIEKTLALYESPF